MLKYNETLKIYLFDRKVFALLLLTKWKILVSFALLGSIISCIIYYIQEGEALGKLEYQSTVMFYVEYNLKPNGEIYYAYNDDGWSYVTIFDEVLDMVVHETTELNLTKEELMGLINIDNKSDYKILSISVISSNKENCIPILEAYVPAMEAYGENTMHIDYIKLASEPTIPKLIIVTDETWRAILGGFVLGVVLGLVICGFHIIITDVFHVMSSLSTTFSIPILRVTLKNGKHWKDNEYKDVCECCLEKKKVVTISLREDLSVENLLQYDGVILEVIAGKTTYGSIERMIQNLELMGIKVLGIYFMQANQWVLTQYYK